MYELIKFPGCTFPWARKLALSSQADAATARGGPEIATAVCAITLYRVRILALHYASPVVIHVSWLCARLSAINKACNSEGNHHTQDGGLQTFLSEGHISNYITVRWPDILRNVIDSECLRFCQINKFFVNTFFFHQWKGHFAAACWRPLLCTKKCSLHFNSEQSLACESPRTPQQRVGECKNPPSPQACSKFNPVSPFSATINEKLLSNHRLLPSPCKNMSTKPSGESWTWPSSTRQKMAESTSARAPSLPFCRRCSLGRGRKEGELARKCNGCSDRYDFEVPV